MTATPERTFMYGNFTSSPPIFAAIGSLMRREPDTAIEILREFSASELVGKVYIKGRGGNWIPVSQPGVREYEWYKDFSTKGLFFVMEGSSPWQVLYFRPESDESGPYVAIGLKLTS